MSHLLRSVPQAGFVIVAMMVALITCTQPTLAQRVSQLDAPAAHEKALKGEVVLVDIRTPEEWKETGVPASAHAITMHQDPKVFLSTLLEAAGGDANEPVAVICRTGSRSTALAAPLSRAGFPNVINIVEGVAGGPNGPGWKKRGLPMRVWTMEDTGPQLAAQ